MNNPSEKIKLYFRKRKHRLSISGTSVRADWILVVCLALIGAVAGAVYAGLLYKGILSGAAFESGEEVMLPDTEHKKRDISETVEFLRND